MFVKPPRNDNEVPIWRRLLSDRYNQKLTTGVTNPPAGDYTVLIGDEVVYADGTAGTMAINLPTAETMTGRILWVKCINDDNAVTVVPNGTELIDASNTAITLILHESITLHSDGTKWWII